MFHQFTVTYQSSFKAVGEWTVNSEAASNEMKFTNSDAVLHACLISWKSLMHVKAIYTSLMIDSATFNENSTI